MSAKVSLPGHFAKLFDFSGREDRASFWPYAAVVLGITMAAGMIIFVPVMMRAMHAMQDYAAQHPEQATVTSGPGQYSVSIKGFPPELIPSGPLILFVTVTFGLAILLYAAAVVRRLHDCGRPGVWGLMPLPFIIYSSAQILRMFAAPTEPDMILFWSVGVSHLLYLATLIWLIVLLAAPSEPAPNRYDKSA